MQHASHCLVMSRGSCNQLLNLALLRCFLQSLCDSVVEQLSSRIALDVAFTPAAHLAKLCKVLLKALEVAWERLKLSQPLFLVNFTLGSCAVLRSCRILGNPFCVEKRL